MKKRIAFLFGSGISIKAGYPRTDEITSLILSGDAITKNSADRYGFSKQSVFTNEGYVQSVISLLDRIKTEIEDYYKHRKLFHLTNYEDIYYIVSQLHDALTGEYDNPALNTLILKLINEPSDLLNGKGFRKNTKWSLSDLCSEAKNFIRDIVQLKLNIRPSHYSYLDIIKSAKESESYKRFHIYTLNHDCLVEKYLGENGLIYSDGFKIDLDNEVKWNPSNLNDSDTDEIQLLKLHGSVGWYYGYLPNETDYFIGKPPFTNHEVSDRPEMLIGTFNKILDYSNKSLYPFLHSKFNNYLNDLDELIISGYSFNDKAINTKIESWINDSRFNRKMVVIHPDGIGVKESARPAIKRQISDWVQLGKAIIIDDFFENVPWSDVESMLIK